MLAAMGADGFAERAARELRATGERVRRRSAETPARLTARETQIGQLAGDGLSNPAIAAQLFMSPRTEAKRRLVQSGEASNDLRCPGWVTRPGTDGRFAVAIQLADRLVVVRAHRDGGQG